MAVSQLESKIKSPFLVYGSLIAAVISAIFTTGMEYGRTTAESYSDTTRLAKITEIEIRLVRQEEKLDGIIKQLQQLNDIHFSEYSSGSSSRNRGR